MLTGEYQITAYRKNYSRKYIINFKKYSEKVGKFVYYCGQSSHEGATRNDSISLSTE